MALPLHQGWVDWRFQLVQSSFNNTQHNTVNAVASGLDITCTCMYMFDMLVYPVIFVAVKHVGLLLKLARYPCLLSWRQCSHASYIVATLMSAESNVSWMIMLVILKQRSSWLPCAILIFATFELPFHNNIFGMYQFRWCLPSTNHLHLYLQNSTRWTQTLGPIHWPPQLNEVSVLINYSDTQS